MADTTLHRFTSAVTPELRAELIDQTASLTERQEPVRRPDGSLIDLAAADDLMTTAAARFYGDWADDPASSDRWLAPRLHYCLRLTRAQASDRNLWAWLAVHYSSYVTWRWSDDERTVSADRWDGRVNKQALMRLWWGAELFRDGPNLAPVERAFIRQDLPNSYLHRPLIRCRSLALAIIDVLAPSNNQDIRSSDEVNDLARVLNLALAGSPPELETDFQRDDQHGLQRWLEQAAAIPTDWDDLPVGPPCADTTDMSRAGGHAVAERGWAYAREAKKKGRSGRRGDEVRT